MAQIRLFVNQNVPDDVMAELNKLQGISAGGRLIEGDGGVVQDEDCVIIYYVVPGSIDRGAVRIPLANVALIDHGIRRVVMGGARTE
jgi:hypothetical protein